METPTLSSNSKTVDPCRNLHIVCIVEQLELLVDICYIWRAQGYLGANEASDRKRALQTFSNSVTTTSFRNGLVKQQHWKTVTNLALPMFFKCCMFFSTVPGIKSKLPTMILLLKHRNWISCLIAKGHTSQLQWVELWSLDHPKNTLSTPCQSRHVPPGLWIITHSSVASLPR